VLDGIAASAVGPILWMPPWLLRLKAPRAVAGLRWQSAEALKWGACLRGGASCRVLVFDWAAPAAASTLFVAAMCSMDEVGTGVC
jgi:hypothetical protein